MANLTRRNQIFFSYSHKDKKWLERFQATLKPLIKANQISVWDDTKIKAGDVWRDEIKQALASAKVAVLLVTTNFTNSDFIAENELPPLLEAARNEGLKIILVVVGDSLYDETELGRYQAVNDPSRPLASISAANREKEIVRICKEIRIAATSTEGVAYIAPTAQTEVGKEFGTSRAATTIEPNVVCTGAKIAVLVMSDWTFYDLKDLQRLEEHAYEVAVIEFENKPIPGRRIGPLFDVEAQVSFYDCRGEERERVEGGAWVGESCRLTAFDVGRRKRLVIAFRKNKGQELVLSAAQNNRNAPSSTLRPTFRELNLNPTVLDPQGKWLRVQVRLIAHGEIINEENFELEIVSVGILPNYLSIKRLPS